MINAAMILFLIFYALNSLAAGDGNKVQVINHAVAAFEKRFEMIERAERSIDVEYFIYNTDEAGRIFTQALIKQKKKHPNLQIRVIVDASAAVLEIDEAYITELENQGIEVRQYNTAPIVSEFVKAQFRDHRKLIVIDGKEAITGSRNIADEYFDLSEKFNFRDRDIWIEGPIVRQMQQSFDEYWDNEWTSKDLAFKPDQELTRKQRKKLRAAKDYVTERAYDRYMRSEVRRVGAPILANPASYGECEHLSYATDIAGPQNASTRKVIPVLFGRLNEMTKEQTLYVESPYFIVKDKSALAEMEFLKEKGVSAMLLTNSLASTDAFYVAANFYPNNSFYQSISNSKMYIFRGDTPLNTPFVKTVTGRALVKDAMFGIHSKTFVFSDSAFAIGTFNVDPRSANLNSEMLMFCEGSPSLSKFVTDDIKSRLGASDVLGKDGKLENGKSLFDGISFFKKLEFKLAIKPSEWFSYLL